MSGTPTRKYSAGSGPRPGFHRQGTESPVGYGERVERARRMSGSGNMLFPTGMGPSRMSPGPDGYSRRTPSRTTPNSQVFRPVPQHLSSPGPRGTYSPITAAMSRPSYAPSPAYGHAGQGHGQSPGPMSPMGKYGSPARTFEWGFPNYPGSNGHPQPGVQQIPGMPSSVAPATADVIALQSQDYVDENLAAFQAQITHLQDEQERIQRKTFVNWINSYLSKRKPQMKVENLIDDLKDGVKLLALLEVLSGERLPMERGRVLRRPHYLSNCNTALEFLRSKRIKLVNINASDVVDGKPAVVLGLIWTIILYFQIEENTRVLEKLGQRYASPSVDRRGYASSTDDDRSVREGSISRKTQEKWKVGAKKALLQWVQAQVSKQLGVQVNDFGPSWRDGNAFLAVVNSIRPGSEVATEKYSGLVDIESMRHLPNTLRLETAFTVADNELGIAPLLDPEDVDVDRPDEKSIMTYVAQFLHRYPEGSEGRGQDRFQSVEAQYSELHVWLHEKISWFDAMHQTRGQAPMDYKEYTKVLMEYKQKEEIHERLRQLVEGSSQVGISADAWQELDTNWQKVAAQVRHWQWLLDTGLPGDFGQIGEWLNQGEALIYGDDIPTQLNEEAAAVLNQKIEDHKSFFTDTVSIQKQFANAMRNSTLVHQIPREQLESIEKRLHGIGPKAEMRAVKLKFLEHKCCIVAFLILTESKLKNWTIKYGSEDKVKQIMNHYRTFVSKNKIFQEFQKAYIEFQQVCDEYKKDGGITRAEGDQIDKFIKEIGDRWKGTSTELRCVQSLLEEVLQHWQRWNTILPEFEAYIVTAYEMLKKSDEEQADFFADISSWKEKYVMLSDTVAFLMATCDQNVGQELNARMDIIINNWEQLFGFVEKYMHSGDISRNRKEYQKGLEKLDAWLRHVEEVLNISQKVESESMRSILEKLMTFHGEVGAMEDLFKGVSRKFQQLVPELNAVDIEEMMFVLKKEKENLVIVRSLIPTKIQLYHHVLTQLEALDSGEQEILTWCNGGDQLLAGFKVMGSREELQKELEQHKNYFVKTVNMQAMLQSKNNVFQSMIKNVEGKEGIDISDLKTRMNTLNEKFVATIDSSKQIEMRLNDALKSWTSFLEGQNKVMKWIQEAQILIAVKHIESKENVETHKAFFVKNNDAIMQNFVQAAQDLKSFMADNEKEQLSSNINRLQEKWNDIQSFAPLHMMKVEFRLDEDTFIKYVKDIEKEISNEASNFHNNDSVGEILKQHNEYFKNNNLMRKVETCLENLARLSRTFTDKMPEDLALQESYARHKDHWDTVMSRVSSLYNQLQQIPEQWKSYEDRFSQMVRWMDSIDESLARMFKGISSPEDFETEKANFQLICRDVELRREDMKWLVQQLDQLVSHRADTDGLSEQKRLEGLITRYKSMIPVIETTMVKIEVYSKSYAFRSEVQEVVGVLEQIYGASTVEKFPDSQEAVEKLIVVQEKMIHSLEEQRSTILGLLQKGKDLSKEPKAPEFLREDVRWLEATWNDSYGSATSNLKKLKDTQKVWENYKAQKSVMIKLLDDAEVELHKIVPKHNHKAIQSDLKINKDMRDDIKRATDDLMVKMKELSETLANVASKEQQEEFAKEMAELESRLNDLLSQCDEKIKRLEDLNIKWSNFNKNLSEMKNFVESAKKNLLQITSLEMSPDDRLKMTKDLQNQVKARMVTLDDLERDAQFLFEDSANIPEVQAIKIEVESVKQDVTVLHHDVDEQSTKVSEDLEHWQNYKNGISKVKPWLEQAEIKMAVGLTKPITLVEAQNIFGNVKTFYVESKDIKTKIDEIGEMSKKIKCKTSATDEVDALKSRWQAAQTTAEQWLQKMESLVQSWSHFNILVGDLKSWVENKEGVMMNKLDLTNPDLNTLSLELNNIKQVLQEASQNQAKLITLTQEGDKVGTNLSQEGSSKLRGEISNLKSRISELAENAQKKIEMLSEIINEKQEFQAKLDDYNNWMADILLKIDELNEIPVENIDNAKEKAHLLSQEIDDKKVLLDKMQKEVDKSKGSDKGEEFYVQFRAITRKHESALSLLEEKKQSLTRWMCFLNWHTESSSHLKYIQQTIESHQTSQKELENIVSELENIAVQCQTRKIEGGDDEEASVKSNTFIIDKETHKPMSILLLVADILQKIVSMKRAIEDKKGQQQNVETKWDEFRQAEQKLADWLQVILSRVQKISVKNSDMGSLENASTAVAELLKENKEKEEVKNIYHDVGRFLMQHDPSQLKVIQDALTEADSKWTKVTNLLTEQQSKSQTLIAMWKQCAESKNIVTTRLEEAADILDSLNELSPQSSNEAAHLVDKCKESVSALKKTRQPFEAFYKRQTQLISELQTVPGFDTSSLKRDLSQVQQKFGFLGEGLTKKMGNLDSQLVIWKQIEQSRDDIVSWTTDTQKNIQEAIDNLSDTEIAKVKLEKYKNEITPTMSNKTGIEQKIEQLIKLNSNKNIEALSKLKISLESEIEETERVANELEGALGNLGESSKLIKEEIKRNIDKLNKVREEFLKSEDTSGSDEQLFDRLNTVKALQGDLNQYEEAISSIEEKIKVMQEEFGSGDVKNLMKEFSRLEKKYDAVCTQGSKLTSMIYSILEKHYVDKVKELTKFNNTFKEKISWCLPEPSSDKYSIECKLESLQDIETTVDGMKPVLNELDICGKVIIKIVEDDKKREIENTMKILNDQIEVIEKEIKKIRLILEQSIEMWKKYELSSENLSSWLKDTEERVRQVTGTQVNLQTFESEMKNLKSVQDQLVSNVDDFKELTHLSETIMAECPESKVEQYVSSLNTRYNVITKNLTSHMEKLQKIFQDKDLQKDSIQEYEKWLKNSKQKLKEFENMKTICSDSKINDFKLIMADKENGSVLLEKAIEAGENMFSEIAPNDRDKMRSEIRSLRDGWENHIDYMNTINKSIEALLLQKSSFDESFNQTQKWIESFSSKIKNKLDIGENLSDKKSIQKNLKGMQQDISSHETILNNLSEKVASIGEPAIMKRFEDSMKVYSELKETNSKNTELAEKYVEEHEQLNQLLEKASDLISHLNIELSVLADTPFDSEDTSKKIQTVNGLLGRKNEGIQILAECEKSLATVVSHTTKEGIAGLNAEVKELNQKWAEFIKNAENFKEQQEGINSKLGVFRTDLENIIQWLKEMDGKVKDQPMRSNVEAKEAQLKTLISLQKTIEKKGKDIGDIGQKAENVDGDSDLTVQVSQMMHKYEILKKNIRDVINKYNSFVKEHKSFNEQYTAFIEWIGAVTDDLGQFGEIVGDLKILQERRNNIEELEELRTNESIKYDTIIEQGEKLYSHTSPDGKDLIRQQLQDLRKKWDNLTEEIQSNATKIDLCLQQFSDFTSSQEQLTKWLKDIEKHMQQHTELKPSIQEKKAQLQNHRIVHQEVTSHNSLVETVCTKAQELVDQTHDKTLNVYIESIRALFKNIGLKSKDLMDKLQVCVNDHVQYQSISSTFSDFTSNQADLLSQCADVTGEKTDLERKKQILCDLRSNKNEGEIKVDELENMCAKVARSTSKRGCEKLKQEIAEIKESWSTHLALIEDVEINIEKGIAQWEQFNSDLSKHHAWFKIYEAVFRNQQLQGTAEEKRVKLNEYKTKREEIIQHEKTIDDFVNNSHNLLHNSGVERLKPVITQISNRYQLLHVLSKEVVSKWQGIVEDHESYSDKHQDMITWIEEIEQSVEKANREIDIEKKMEELQSVASEQEQGPLKISNFSATGERLFPDTSTQGREILRQEIRLLRDKWDAVIKRVGDMQKRQDAQLQHWSSYQDSLTQLVSWLEAMEASTQQEQVNWLSIQETRSRLLKYKATLQDIVSHKRFIETVNERGAAVINSNPIAPAEEIQETIENINERYGTLQDSMKKTVANMEDAMECIQQYQELQKSHQDWQKQMWDRLSVYTDYTGSKHALETRLDKISDMQKQVNDGERVLESIKKHINSMDEDKIPSKVKEAMERDLSNIKFDFDKFISAVQDVKQGVNERLRQWSEYEAQLEKLINWLSESETALKNYSHKSSMEEKQEQVERFKDKQRIIESKATNIQDFVSLADQLEQSLMFNLRQGEGEMDKLSEDGSDISALSGDTKISMNVQQINSRYHTVQSTVKEILKKCEQAVVAHKMYEDKYNDCMQWLTKAEEKYNKNSDVHGNREEILGKISLIEEMLSEKHFAMSKLNSSVEFGEKLFGTTAPEGREGVRLQLQDLQSSLETLYDKIAKLERDLQNKLTKWTGYEESSATFTRWLQETQDQLKGKLILKTTLDEKKAQLQIYRTLLQDIKSQKPVLDDLKEKSNYLPEKSDKIESFVKTAGSKHEEVMKKGIKCVEEYEGIVNDHYQYMKAVMETSEWLTATANTVELWGDNTLERLSLHANLERLKSLQISLPEEQPKVDNLKSCGLKVIPGTVESGQINIRSQIDTTTQEWQGLLSSVQLTIESLENKIKQWQEYESLKDTCLMWLRDTDTKLHAFDLNSNLKEKSDQLETLKSLQGEVKAKELEIDTVTERSQQLHKEHTMRTSHLTELSVKYQNISAKVKDLFSKWQQYVGTHSEYEAKLGECSAWINDINVKLGKAQDMSMLTQNDIEAKISALNDLILCKDEGFGKVQNIVELAQSVLANTSAKGHTQIVNEMEVLQTNWSQLVAKLGESRVAVDDSISKWSGFLDSVNQLKLTVHNMDKIFNAVSPTQSQSNEKRAQIDKLRNLDEKIRVEKIEVENLKIKATQMLSSGQQNKSALQAQEVLAQFDALDNKVKGLLQERELQFRDHKAFRLAQENLAQYIQRCRDKISTMRQRSPNDKNFVEAVTQALDHLINKEAQGQILAEQLQQTGDVLASVTAEPGKSGIKKEVIAMTENFNTLFVDVKKQREQMNKVMTVFRDFKEETERLSDWLQQADINIKASKTSLLSTIEEKEKGVRDMNELNKRLIGGKKDFDKYAAMALQMKGTCLESNVNSQLKETMNKYQLTCSLASDILKKSEAIHDHHYEFEQNVKKTKNWIEEAWKVIRGNINSEGKSKEDLHGQLDRLRQLNASQEEGQGFLHAAIDWAEKACRNSRSDGKDKINTTLKDLQAEWEKLLKKMSTAKVSIETDLLQWSDTQQSVSRLQEWISDRETRLQQVSQQRTVMITRRSTLGITTLSVSERQATLRRTNSILQDIQAFEPMIQTVASSAQSSENSDITSKYQSLTKHAQEMYEKEKEMVAKHEIFMEAGNEFMTWLKVSQEKLDKCSEPTGDKESLASKSSQLKVLDSEKKFGQQKLGEALKAAAEACKIALEDDQEIIEEEVAFLQDEFDQYSDDLIRCKSLLEGGIVKWTDYQELYQEALDWLDKTETSVQGYNNFQSSMQDKRKILEEFQLKLQAIFDWQKELDILNKKGQILLENCADSRVSNAITQLSTKYQALLSLAKEVVRRLELHFQEHHQHSALCKEFKTWIEQTRETLQKYKKAENTHEDLEEKLNGVKSVRTMMEQGQNKLRYLQDLKERVLLNTDSSGAKAISDETSGLKKDFENLMVEVQDVKTNLSSRFDLLGDLEKSNKLLLEWIEDTEGKMKNDVGFLNDLGEKRANLEKYRTIEKDIDSYKSTVAKLEAKIKDHPNIPNQNYADTIARFSSVKEKVKKMITTLTEHVSVHESYRDTYTETVEYIRKIKMDLQKFGSSHGDKSAAIEKESKLSAMIDEFPDGDNLLRNVARYSTCAVNTSGDEGKDTIKQEEYQLRYDWDQARNQARAYLKTMKKCVEAWNDYEKLETSMAKWIKEFQPKIEQENDTNDKTLQDLERRRGLFKEANKQKYEMESMNDKCEILMEYCSLPEVRDQTVNYQSSFTNLYTSMQSLVSRAEQCMSDHTDFNKAKEEFDEWYHIAHGTVQDSCNPNGTAQAVKQRLELIKSVSSRMTEGQHLLNCTSEALTKVLTTTEESQQEEMKSALSTMRKNCDQLTMNIGKQLSIMKNSVQRWDIYNESLEEINTWLNDTEESIRETPDSKGQLGEMKTSLQRFKYISGELKKKQDSMEKLKKEARELSTISGDESVYQQFTEVEKRLEHNSKRCQEIKSFIETEVEEYNSYQQNMQETEKWLLQISFQLMAHNSLYITTREQTQQQLEQHEQLLDQIKAYQTALEKVRTKGDAQVARYINSNPDIKATNDKQHQNVQESYNSLLHTATQIKNRLLDSLEKFKEYEETLESIIENIEKWEPEISEELSKPIDNIEMATAELDNIRGIHNRLQNEKSRLATAIQACETATASISRPTSPMDDENDISQKREGDAKLKLEDLIDQDANFSKRLKHLVERVDTLNVIHRFDELLDLVQNRMSELGAQVNELGDVQRQKDSLAKWIETTENSVAEYLKRPSKFRPDASQMEINMVTDLQQTLIEKQAALDDICQRDSTPDYDLKIALETLDGHITMLLDKKYSQQGIIEDFRYEYQECQTWFEKISKSLTEIDENMSMNSDERLQKLQEIVADFEANKDKPSTIDDKSKFVLQEIGDMDQQQVNEQTKSVQRRMIDLKKRIDRKKQIIEMAQTGYNNTKKEIEDTEKWFQTKNEEIRKFSSSTEMNDKLSDCKSKVKEVESKLMVIESLETKIDTISSDLEASEYEELKQKLTLLIDEQKKLSIFAKSTLKTLVESSDYQKKFDNDFGEVQNWIKIKTTEFFKGSEYDPLKATNMEKKVARLKKDLTEITEYEESKISQVKLGIISLQKNGDSKMKSKVDQNSKEIDTSLKSLKDHIRKRISDLEEKLELQREFEIEFEKCVSWLDQAETILSTEVRGTINIAILDEHHYKFQKLKRDEEDNRKRVTEVFEKANKIMEKLTDADRISLQTQMDDVCDKQNHVADTVNAKINNLVKNIEVYKSTAQKIENSVNHLTEIQRQIRLLNKPIGYRVEDAEDVLEAYGKILNNLKSFKSQMEDLQKTAGTNVNELKALLVQQEELISAIENQMVKIRNLIAVRHQFMTMITGITSFIIKHTEVVKEVERSNIPPMEKVKKYDESVAKLKDCETQLSLASDKGQQIANEGSTSDRNQITQQLQSLKTQILTLKKAIERKRDEHIKSVQEHTKIYGDLESHLEWIQEKEAEVKSQPLLKTTVADVENHVMAHKEMTQSIMEYIEKIKNINEAARKEDELPPRVFEMLSTASALIQAMPRDLEERKQYLENNKNYRLQYDSLVERLNNWVEEAQIKLRPFDSGIDFENLQADMEEHKKYFSEETKLRDLLHSIHDTANKIWASLAPNDQEKINHEQEFLTQLVKNTLNSAHSKQGEFEENIKLWQAYSDNVDKIKSIIEDLKYDRETPSSLAGVKTSIQKVDNQIRTVQSRKGEFDGIITESKKIEASADTINRHKISEEALGLNQEWKNIINDLKEHKENLATLALQWDDFDTKYKSFDSLLAQYHQQFANVDTVFTSIRQMNEIKKTLKSLMEEVKNLEGRYKDVMILSDNVIRYLGTVNPMARQELEINMTSVTNKYKMLISQLEDRVKVVSEEIASLEGVDKKADELHDKIMKLNRALAVIKVWHQDHAETEEKLLELRSDIETCSSLARDLHHSTRKKLSDLGQSLPPDTGDKLANIELMAEKSLTDLEECESEHKRARNVRYDFQVDVEEVQFWITRSESKIQDRSLEPHSLKNNLNEIQSEINGISEQLDNLLSNGKVITEKTDNHQEKELVLSTTTNLSEQIAQLKQLIQDKKNAANDAIDAWQRFLQFHAALKAWCEEKESFLNEPFTFTNLSSAKLKLQDYNTSLKSIKNATKNLGEMEKELKKISTIGSTGDLGDKLSDAEREKVDIESSLMEKNAILQEMTEEWDQCEKKLKETRTWITKAQDNIDSLQNKKRPIRDQLNLRDKMLSDITIQRKRAVMALEKLKVHFREEITTEQDIQKLGKEISKDLDLLAENVKEQCKTLEACLTQLDQYQQEIGLLRQQILSCEGELRTVSSPAYTAKDRDKALAEQSACRERIKGLQSKITAFSQRMNLINQRGTPDSEEMTS